MAKTLPVAEFLAMTQILGVTERCPVCKLLVHCEGEDWHKIDANGEKISILDHGNPNQVSVSCRKNGEILPGCLIDKFYRR